MTTHAIDVDTLVAFDVHVHLEHTGEQTDADKNAAAYFKGGAARDPAALAEYYRSRKMACVIFTVDETLSGTPRLSNDEVVEFAAKNADIAIPFASINPTRGAEAVREARRLVATGAGARAEAAPADPGVLPQRSHRLSALRGVRRGAAAGALPHRPQRHRHRHARRRRHPAEVRPPDADRRRGGGLSGHADHHGAPVVPVAGRGDLGLPAQAAGLHRPVRLVAEVLLADARSSTRTRC